MSSSIAQIKHCRRLKIYSDEECKKIISKVAWELGVSPGLISTRLLDEQDKNDLRQGVLTKGALKCATEVWRDNGMPDYAHGKDVAMKWEKKGD